VLQVAEAPGGYTQVDVVFEKDGKRFLETFPQSRVEPVADIFQRYQNGESDHPMDFFLKQLAYQLPLENLGGELSNSKDKLKMFTRNLEAKIRSDYDGVINVRYKCVGIQAIN
jgi:hypothetical protein